MVSKVLTTIASRLPKEIESNTEDSLEWFKDNVRKIKLRPEKLIKSIKQVSPSGLKQGKVYMFFYDAKHQETLPYWDKYPIVVPLEKYKDGFLGMNLHYISPSMRLVLLKPLLEQIVNVDETTLDDARMLVDYNLIDGQQDLRFAKPCIKRYLTSHIGARIVEVPYENWETMMMLPLAKFNVSANTVYADSRRKLR